MIRPSLYVWIVLGLVLAAYVGVPQAGYVYDDHPLVEVNRALSDPTWARVFGADLWCCNDQSRTGYYRPLLTVSLLVERWLFGAADAGVSHVHSLLWHLLCVGLAYVVLARRIGPTAAAAGALLFGLHPIQSEAVLWVSARNDLLAAAGVLAVLAALDRGSRRAAALCTLAACLSKENAFLLPVVAFAWRRAWGERLPWRDLAAIGVGITGALALRSQAHLAGFGMTQADALFDARTGLHAAATVLGWITIPWPLTSTTTLHMRPPLPTAWIGAVATLLLLGALLARGGPRARWLLLISLVLYAPAALGVRWYGTVGERYLYLPLFGIAAALVSLPVRAVRARALVLAAAAVAALAALHVRVAEWANEEVLFEAALRRRPDANSANLVGVEYIRQGRYAESALLFHTALVWEPPKQRACLNVVQSNEWVLDTPTLLERVAFWDARGCGETDDFVARVVPTLAARGRWVEAAAWLARARTPDPRFRDLVVGGALAARDGDLDALAGLALTFPGGASIFMDQVLALVNGTHVSERPTAAVATPD